MIVDIRNTNGILNLHVQDCMSEKRAAHDIAQPDAETIPIISVVPELEYVNGGQTAFDLHHPKAAPRHAEICKIGWHGCHQIGIALEPERNRQGVRSGGEDSSMGTARFQRLVEGRFPAAFGLNADMVEAAEVAHIDAPGNRALLVHEQDQPVRVELLPHDFAAGKFAPADQ